MPPRERKFAIGHLFFACALACSPDACNGNVEETFNLKAVGHDSRVDLHWEPVEGRDLTEYHVYRSTNPDGPFLRLNAEPHELHVYSD